MTQSATAPSATERAKTIVSNCLLIPPESIAEDAVLEELAPLDSLALELLVMEIETATGRRLDLEELLTVRTVQDIARLVQAA